MDEQTTKNSFFFFHFISNASLNKNIEWLGLRKLHDEKFKTHFKLKPFFNLENLK